MFSRRNALFYFPRGNVRENTNFTCRYDTNNDTLCPIVRIGTIVDSLNLNSTRQAALFKNVNTIDWENEIL